MIDELKTPETMTRGKLIACVRQGRAVTVKPFDDDWVYGFISGFDDDFLYLLQVMDPWSGGHNLDSELPNEDQMFEKLINLNTISWIHMHPEQNFREHPMYSEMRKIVYPFRDWINKNYKK